jgi:hypothetical protein
MPVILVLKKQRQEGHGFKASVGYIESSRSAWATC